MSKITKSAILLLLILLLALSLFACKGGEEEDATAYLTVYNCEDYIDEEIFEDFTDWYYEKSGKRVEINYITYDTNETMLTKVLNNDANVDVICSSEYAIQKLYLKDQLLPLEKTEGMATINQAIYERTSARFGEDFASYFVPYMYGTLGILYNADFFEENEIDIEEAGWGILWNDVECDELNGKILLKDSIRDTFAAGVLYLKEQDALPEAYRSYTTEALINCTDEELVAAVKEALIAEKSALKAYEVDFGKDDLIKGSAYVDLAWSGDAMYAIEEGEVYDVGLDYFVPEAGANIWFDGWFIPKCTKHKDAAEAFIEFLCDPEISTRNMVYIGYSSAVDRSFLVENPDVLAVLAENEYIDASTIVESEDAVAILTENGYLIEEEEEEVSITKDGEECDIVELVAFLTERECYDLASDYFEWEVRYPEVDNPDYGMMTDYGESNTRMTIMWEEVKAATPENRAPVWLVSLIVIGVILLLVGGAVGIYYFLTNKRRSRLKEGE